MKMLKSDNIISLSKESKRVVLSSRTQQHIKQTNMNNPTCCYVIRNSVINIANGQEGIYKSIDNGMNWIQIFCLSDRAYCVGIITFSFVENAGELY